MPTISVIVPVYKVEPYIHRCIDSILAQTFTDFELILVDDGSPDNCPAICDEYAEIDNRIHVIHQENGGLSAARNAGLDIASGKYIYFVDGDDSVKSNLLETVIIYLDLGADLVVFNRESIYLDGKANPYFHEAGTYTLSKENRIDFYLNTLLSYKIGWEAWNRIFRRDIIETYHLRFADNQRIFAEDLYFSLCYCAHIHEIISLPQSLYCYTVRGDSIMRQNKTEINAGRMNELGKEVFQHFQEHEDCNPLINVFPVLHYLIVDNVVSKVLYTSANLPELRAWLRNDITDWTFYSKTMSSLLKRPKYLRSRYSGSQLAERLSILTYFLDGNYTTLRIRNKLILMFSKLINAYYK